MTYLYVSHIELVEQLSHVVLAACNLQLGWIGKTQGVQIVQEVDCFQGG